MPGNKNGGLKLRFQRRKAADEALAFSPSEIDANAVDLANVRVRVFLFFYFLIRNTEWNTFRI